MRTRRPPEPGRTLVFDLMPVPKDAPGLIGQVLVTVDTWNMETHLVRRVSGDVWLCLDCRTQNRTGQCRHTNAVRTQMALLAALARTAPTPPAAPMSAVDEGPDA